MATLERDGPDESGAVPVSRTATAPQGEAAERTGARRRVPPRMALPALAIAALLAAGAGFLHLQGSGPNIAPVTVASDGIPSQVDGQRVYRTQDQLEWLNLRGSFLLGARVASGYGGLCLTVLSTAPITPSEQAAMDLSGNGCGGELSGISGPEVEVAPRGSFLLDPWNNELAVVRIHTHDPEAAQCDASVRDWCNAALVVDQVLWPTVPSEFHGEHVYRAADSAQFDKLQGSFLLGGFVADMPLEQDSLPATEVQASAEPCEPPAPTAQQLLLPDCPTVLVDGARIAAASKVVPARNRVAIVRAHVDDALAAKCPADVMSDCEKAIVVESEVWSYDPYAAPYSIPEATLPQVGQLAPDGIPTTIAGQAVYRADSLPPDSTFLLGGKLSRNASCTSGSGAPTAGATPGTACSSWEVGGVAVRTVVDIPAGLAGRLVAVRVARSKVSDCPSSASCSSKPVLVVTELDWTGP
jgi:hypothetical protein